MRIQVIKNATDYKIDTTRIGLWGASAGGNLAAALVVRHMQSGTSQERPDLRFVSLVVPVTAHPRAFAVFEKNRDSPKSSNELLFAKAEPAPSKVVDEFEKLLGKPSDCFSDMALTDMTLEMYVGPTDVCDVLVSPLMSQPNPLHPQTHITVAACDYLRPQGQAYAEKLRLAGVRVTEDILPGVPHGFTFALNAKVTRAWLERQVAYFADALKSDR